MQPSVENTYRVVRFMFLSSIVWLLIGMTFGLILALKYVWPEFLAFGPLQKYLQYGRIRPIHTNLVLLGWLTMAYLAPCSTSSRPSRRPPCSTRAWR